MAKKICPKVRRYCNRGIHMRDHCSCDGCHHEFVGSDVAAAFRYQLIDRQTGKAYRRYAFCAVNSGSSSGEYAAVPYP